jgi:hypothetical protein
MGRQRLITMLGLAALVGCAMPASALASSTLLSGYGGPGQGNQAIIGSTLVGGSGGGRGGAGGGEAPASSSAGSTTSLVLAGAAAGSSPAGSKVSRPARSRAGHSSKPASPAYQPTTLSSASGDGGATLGLTGSDVFYIVLAFGALVLTALVTVRLARRVGGTQ